MQIDLARSRKQHEAEHKIHEIFLKIERTKLFEFFPKPLHSGDPAQNKQYRAYRYGEQHQRYIALKMYQLFVDHTDHHYRQQDQYHQFHCRHLRTSVSNGLCCIIS